jgi:hypothetical protein
MLPVARGGSDTHAAFERAAGGQLDLQGTKSLRFLFGNQSFDDVTHHQNLQLLQKRFCDALATRSIRV